jgi:hypothetical protein
LASLVETGGTKEIPESALTELCADMTFPSEKRLRILEEK